MIINGREVEPYFTDEEVEKLLDQHMDSVTLYRMDIMIFATQLRDAVEKKVYEQSITGVMDAAVPWQRKTFPLATLQSIANHILSEAKELVKKPDDAAEVADILLLIGAWCDRTKINIWAAMRNKLRENMGRTWGEVNEQGFVEHVREEPVRHYMRIDSQGRPYGIGSTSEGLPLHEFVAPNGEHYRMRSLGDAVKENWRELAEQKKDHWEPVEREDGIRGRVFVYYRDGKMFAREPEYDTN